VVSIFTLHFMADYAPVIEGLLQPRGSP